jgi:hypothetical protein
MIDDYNNGVNHVDQAAFVLYGKHTSHKIADAVW